MPGQRQKYIPARFTVGQRRRQNGQAILESMLVMLVVCLLFFGLLQIFHLTAAKMITDYSAATAGRSSAVGFAEYLVDRNGRCASIAASGALTYPSGYGNTNPISQYANERILIPQYIVGDNWLEYQYWYGGETTIFSSEDEDSTVNTSLGISQNRSTTGLTTVRAGFNDYPLVMPMRYLFTTSKATNIASEATYVDFATEYLDE